MECVDLRQISRLHFDVFLLRRPNYRTQVQMPTVRMLAKTKQAMDRHRVNGFLFISLILFLSWSLVCFSDFELRI